jgi:cytochrome c biogenesis protein CcdA
MLGASLGRSDKARPAFIALGFVGSFAAAAVFFSVTTQVAGIDQTVLRAVAAVLLAAFGAVMLWPHPFEWIWIRVGARLIPGDVIVVGFAQGFGALALGTALGLVWTPCAGPVLASILTLIATANSVRRASPAALALSCLSAMEPLHRNPVPRGVRARQRLRRSRAAVASGCTIKLYHLVKCQSKKR